MTEKFAPDNQTEFVYVLGTAAEATNSGFITFVDRTPRRKQAAVKAEVYHPLNQPDKQDDDDTPTAIHINLQIEPAERANMKIIMDFGRRLYFCIRNRQPAHQLL